MEIFEIDSLREEYGDILTKLTDPELISDWEKFEELSKRKKKLEDVIQKHDELLKIDLEEEQNKKILSDENDAELISLAEGEADILKEKRASLEKELFALINAMKEGAFDKNESGPVIMEIRSGTGGEEAALFAEDLFRMYSRYAQKKGWRQKILNSSRTELGGLKEVIFELKNGEIYPFLKYEGGVHRVQRVPETEKQGRIHTSTISVAILLKPKKGTVKVNPADLKIDTFKASGPGGQYVNKRETAVRITHIPTNIVVASQNERSLAQNKDNAMSILEARILEKSEKEAKEKIGKERKEQVGKAERSEKIRTYNFPQNRITDHRVQKNWHDIENVLNGNLDPIIGTLQKQKNQ